MDQEMAETQLALGNLFRRRGEFDRAIKIHQNLVNRSISNSDINADALLELGNDYVSSGLLDRAESLYEQLISRERHVETAYDALVAIYEREKDWVRAIKFSLQSLPHDEGERQARLGHYFCEMADAAVSEGDSQVARSFLKKALEAHSASARANILRGDLAMERQDFLRAIECYTEVERQNPTLTPEIISPLFTAYCESGNEQALLVYIQHIRNRNNSYSVIKTTREMIEKLSGAVAADRFFKEQLLKRPSLKGLRDWAQSELKNSKPEEKEKVLIIIKMLDSVVDDKPAYVCSDCGFKAKTIHWQCPSCAQWDTVRTVIGAEGE
jgi:lipopolysaccharide biosynthesis regulator YciM